MVDLPAAALGTELSFERSARLAVPGRAGVQTGRCSEPPSLQRRRRRTGRDWTRAACVVRTGAAVRDYPHPSKKVGPNLFGLRCGAVGWRRLTLVCVESRCGAVAVGWAYRFPPLSSGGASLAQPWLRFHIPLIEPDRRISRIRLSDKTSRLHPRRAATKLGQAYEPEVLVKVRGG